MSGRFIALVVAAIGWLFAALFAYAIVTLFGFFGVGFFGLLILFICTQVELEFGSGRQALRCTDPGEAEHGARGACLPAS